MAIDVKILGPIHRDGEHCRGKEEDVCVDFGGGSVAQSTLLYFKVAKDPGEDSKSTYWLQQQVYKFVTVSSKDGACYTIDRFIQERWRLSGGDGGSYKKIGDCHIDAVKHDALGCNYGCILDVDAQCELSVVTVAGDESDPDFVIDYRDGIEVDSSSGARATDVTDYNAGRMAHKPATKFGTVQYGYRARIVHCARKSNVTQRKPGSFEPADDFDKDTDPENHNAWNNFKYMKVIKKASGGVPRSSDKNGKDTSNWLVSMDRDYVYQAGGLSAYPSVYATAGGVRMSDPRRRGLWGTLAPAAGLDTLSTVARHSTFEMPSVADRNLVDSGSA